jgi:N-acetylated-alpha-linked acidic dipeptidase
MANADVLPFDYTSTTETIDRYLDELETEAAERNLSDRVDLNRLRKANASLDAAASVLNDEIARLLETGACNEQKNQTAIRQLNGLLVEAERGFLHAEGLPGRPWYRHQIYAPGFYTGYGVKTLPGVREALEKGDDEEANEMALVLENALGRVRRTLLDAIVVAAGVGE